MKSGISDAYGYLSFIYLQTLENNLSNHSNPLIV